MECNYLNSILSWRKCSAPRYFQWAIIRKTDSRGGAEPQRILLQEEASAGETPTENNLFRMKKEKANPAKELYKQMRVLTCKQLWDDEVMRFDRATPQERMERVAVVRAVGVVFSETGTEEQKEKARTWLRRLLHDPCEKIRRYAMAAMPKIGAGPGEEAELLGTAADHRRKSGEEVPRSNSGEDRRDCHSAGDGGGRL